VTGPVYLYSGQKRHVADPAVPGDGERQRMALCGHRHDTVLEMVAKLRRYLTGDLTLQRRVERAKSMPVCSWCSRRWAELPPSEGER
jgi:hypothetical protein